MSWSPYWKTNNGCLASTRDKMVGLTVHGAGRVVLTVDVSAGAALATLEGENRRRCAR